MITLHPYLDDWLYLNQNRRRLLEHRQFILSLITSLGLIINYEKSDLVPAQVFTFIGMEFLTHTNIVTVPQTRQMKILETVRMVLQKTSVSARDFLSLLGQLNAAADFVMLGPLHLRPLQISLHNQWQPQKLPLCHQIRMTTEILQHLKWWLQEDLYHQGIPLKIDPPSHTIFTDPSLSGWGAHVEREGLLFHGPGTEDQSRLHINVLESNFSLSITSSSQGKELHCFGVNGHHDSGSLYKASGRDSFHRTLRRSVERPELVLSPQHTSVSEAHTGQVQHSSRPDVPSRQTDLHRVVPESGNSKQGFPDHGLSINRPVRHMSEPQAANICVTHTGSEGAINRYPFDGLESHTRLPISTVPSYSSCDKQNTVIPVQDSIVSTSMARQTMVFRASRSVGVTTGISASNSKPASSAKRQNSASKPGPSTASRLGIVKQSLRDRQFSSEVAEHVSKARRVSTAKVYDAKRQIFRDWANQRKIDPIQTTPQIQKLVADFLTFLFSVKKCQVSSIKGYRSTISNTLKYKTGYDFGSHPVLSELIKSFAIQRPVDRSLAPKWDLAFVLSHMCKAPFEPLDKASLFYLSVKTVFFVTLATARRVSEVHALSMDSDHLRFSNLDGSLILRTQLGFLAKNQLPSRAPDSIKIPKLSNLCRKSDNFNRMLCPVRAVKIYFNKTKSLRKHRKRLFIPTQGDHDLNKSTISRWVKYAIKHAYGSISKNPNRLFNPRAHELRAISASWAYMNFIPLEEVLKSPVWSSSSLFASHYLRDFREQTENLRAIGPIIAAQKVVGGGRANLVSHEDK